MAPTLARLIPAGVDVRGNATRARIVLFRKPIERWRAKRLVDLTDLLHEILVAQVATYLGASNPRLSTRYGTPTTDGRMT